MDDFVTEHLVEKIRQLKKEYLENTGIEPTNLTITVSRKPQKIQDLLFGMRIDYERGE